MSTNLKIFKKVLLTSSLFAFSSATFAGSSESFSSKKTDLETKSIFEKPLLIAENIEKDSLTYSGFDTLKITVTGTRTERAIKDVPAAVSTFDYDLINEIAPLSWRDIFKYDASINSQDFLRSDSNRSYAKDDKGNINIRGVEGNRVLTLIDGIPITRFSYGNGTYSVSRLNYIDFGNIGQTEVLKGAGSSLYGSNAMGGVVSIKTLDPDDILEEDRNNTFEISSSFNSQNNSFTPSIKYAFRENDLAGVFATNFSKSNELQRNTDEIYQSDLEADSQSYFLKLIKTYGNTDYNVVFENVNKDKISNSSPYINSKEGTTSGKDTGEDSRTRVSLGANYKSDQDQFIDEFSAQIYVNELNHKNDYFQDYPISTSFNPATFTMDVTPARTENTKVALNQKMVGGNVQISNNISKNDTKQKITYGIEVNHNDASRTREAFENGISESKYKSNPDTDITKYGIYLQNEIKLNKWEFIPGIRYSSHNLKAKSDSEWFASGNQYLASSAETIGEPVSKDYTNFSPSISAIYNFNNNINFYGKYGRTFRTPSWEDLNSSRISVGLFGNYATMGNPNLKSETGDNFEIGIKGRTKKADFGISTFYNKYQDFLRKSASDGTVFVGLNTANPGLVGTTNVETDPTQFVNDYSGYTTPVVAEKEISLLRTLNVDSVNIWGIEADYKYHFSQRNKGLSFNGSASLVKGRNETEDQNLDSINPFTAIATFDYLFPNNKYSISLTNTYVGSPSPSKDYIIPQETSPGRFNFPAENVFIPDSFITTDFVLKYSPSKNFSTNLGIYNLFDKTYYLWSDMRNNGLQGNDDFAYQRYAQPGRSLQAGFSWRF